MRSLQKQKCYHEKRPCGLRFPGRLYFIDRFGSLLANRTAIAPLLRPTTADEFSQPKEQLMAVKRA
jgi:hypothetical protein